MIDETNKWRMEALKYKAAYGKELAMRKQLEEGINRVQQKFNQAIITLTDEIRRLRNETRSPVLNITRS